jgi:hypothetical protein
LISIASGVERVGELNRLNWLFADNKSLELVLSNNNGTRINEKLHTVGILVGRRI